MQTLASKPFGRDVAVKGNPPDEIIGKLDADTGMRSGGLVDDIDGRGNSLTTFANEAFSSAITNGGHAILVDYPPMEAKSSIAAERAAGARPYWVQVPFDAILALYTDVVGGREVISHVRIKETATERDGFGEKTVTRVRVLEPGKWELFEQDAKSKWKSVNAGVMNRGGKTGVPLALCFLGKRLGTQEVRPPLANVAQMQIELYQALSRQEEILTFAGSPMLSANGMNPPANQEPVKVGPRSVLFAPPSGQGVHASWTFVQPDAKNIKEIRETVTAIQADMRRIGLQPLTEQPGNQTATGKAIEAAKAHSAVKSWALLLNDQLEQAMVFTAEFMGVQATIQTEVSTDFSVLPYAAEPLKALAVARATKDISRRTYWDMLKRFDVLSPDFDPAAEDKLIAAEPAPPIQEDVQIRT